MIDDRQSLGEGSSPGGPFKRTNVNSAFKVVFRNVQCLPEALQDFGDFSGLLFSARLQIKDVDDLRFQLCKRFIAQIQFNILWPNVSLQPRLVRKRRPDQ